MTPLARSAVAVVAVLAAGPSPAQDPAGRRYAVLAGVNEYDHPKLPALRFAENDVAELDAVLRRAGYAVTKVAGKDATKRAIEDGIRAVLAKCRRGDTVLIALAGHGLQFEGDKDSYFCPAGAKPFPDEAGTLVSLGGVYRELDKSFAGIKVLLVDACRDDPAGGRGIDADTAPKPPAGVAALFSCRAGERAFEHPSLKHGVFFHHVLEGLNGKAKDSEGEVTFAGLAAYVSRGVSRAVPKLIGNGAKQSPNLKADYSTEPVLIAAGLAPAVAVPRPPAVPARPADGWTPLLKADSLDGWAVHGAADWAVAGGVLAAGGKGSGWVYTQTAYTDFELELEYKLPARGNSGIFLRAAKDGPLNGADQVEVQLLDDAAYKCTDSQRTGAVWNKAAATATPAAPAGQWNRARVRVAGDRVTVAINGTQTVDADIPWGDRRAGPVGLQMHRAAAEFRNIRVRDLGAGGAAPEFVELFNGRDLTGWAVRPGEPANWAVQDGVLVARGAKTSHLLSDREVADFHLRAECRVNDGGNSGIYFRAAAGTAPAWPDGYEAQINTGPKGGAPTGSLYIGNAVQSAPAGLVRPGEWFTYEVVAAGNRITLRVNGRAVTTYTDPARRFSRGRIGLQQHNGNGQTVVEFRRIEVKDLPPAAGGAARAGGGFVPLFNGRDLAGWREVGAKGGWRVEAGELVVDGGAQPGSFDRAGWLMTDKEYADFTLRLEFRVAEFGNSGVGFRCDPGSARQAEVQVLDEAHPAHAAMKARGRTGALFGLTADRPRPDTARGVWHTMEVDARGRQLKVTVDGTVTVDDGLDGYVTEARRSGQPGVWRDAGPIGLQKWTGVVRFRNIEIKE